MLTDKRREHFDNRWMVARGVDHDPFQRVDRAQPHIQTVRSELFDGLGVPVGDMAFAGQAEVQGRVDEADGYDEAGAQLEQAPADCVDCALLLDRRQPFQP